MDQCYMCGKYGDIDHVGTPGEIKWVSVPVSSDSVGVYVCSVCLEKIGIFIKSQTAKCEYTI